VNAAFDLGCIFIRMALQAQFSSGNGGQLDAGCITGDPNFVATGTADRNRRMYGLPFRLCIMALEAFRVIGLRSKGRM
jgi:hypothetical protein